MYRIGDKLICHTEAHSWNRHTPHLTIGKVYTIASVTDREISVLLNTGIYGTIFHEHVGNFFTLHKEQKIKRNLPSWF